MAIFQLFKMTDMLSWIFKFLKFLVLRRLKMVELHHRAKFWLKSVKMWPRYGDFSIFQDGGRRHIGFLKFEIFSGRTAQEGRNASPCQI